MRALVAIVIVVVILGLVGWLRFGSTDGDPTIRVDSNKVKQDTAVIVEKSKQAVDSAAETIDRTVEKLDD